MNLCRAERCRWWGEAKPGHRKCYYEPDCWRGYLDLLFFMFKLRRRAELWNGRKRVG